MKTHILKTWPQFYQDIASGRKGFEIRKNDRDFRVGDRLLLCEYYPDCDRFSGNELTRLVTYMTDFGQTDNYVVMSLKEI